MLEIIQAWVWVNILNVVFLGIIYAILTRTKIGKKILDRIIESAIRSLLKEIEKEETKTRKKGKGKRSK